MRNIVSGFVCLALMHTAAALSAQTKGTITVQVLDHVGRPLANATVEFVPIGVILATALPWCLTDASGVCSKDLGFAKYHVTAMKKADGYPDLTFNFYSHGKWPATTAISRKKPVTRVTFRLGPRAALLTLNIIDSVTEVRIEHVAVTLRPVADPKNFFSTSLGQDSTVLIPAREDVAVEVEAKGYKPWDPQNSIRLDSGESKQLTVDLHSL